ncbi:elongation factor G [Flaviflagellibacter deserti]|uniref:Elongation factor G n=1 Tax=Flaviflagellibacter deserti TaxID=2267266 RepID=A0ABV9Z434_9HYPH
MGQDVRPVAGPRCIALVGPFQSGKTSLLEAILAYSGAIPRAGNVEDGTTIGDTSAEARAHRMSTEMNVATVDFFGDAYTFVDCPGSVEFLEDMRRALPAVDAAVVVCEADERKVPALQQILRLLEDQGIPRFLFLNKIDKAESRIRDALEMLQPSSRTPLLVRQIPVWENEIITGYIDLALERAFVYREHAESNIVDIAEGERIRQREARFAMLEKLADHDDELLETLLEDLEPPKDRVFDDLSRELKQGLVVPVLLGSALRGNGVLRLLKALRHEAPCITAMATRAGMAGEGDPAAYVLKTVHTAHGGKLSVVRMMRGAIPDGATVMGSNGAKARIAAIQRLTGAASVKVGSAVLGDTVALARLDGIQTGQMVTAGPVALPEIEVESPDAVVSATLLTKERKDDVKLSAGLAKLVEEDPSYHLCQTGEGGEIRLDGQGEMHLRVATERLAERFGVAVTSKAPRVGYRETIRGKTSLRGRHKKQSGGHGQFGDVVLEIEALPRGEGIRFEDKITGGVVPRQFIPSVEKGVRDALRQGPLGFPVTDVLVRLVDGSFHTVDSSDAAFQAAGRIAISEGLPQCSPALLEPMFKVEVYVPNDATAKINAILSARRGQILGFDARGGWPGWDVVQAILPEAEIGDLIIEIRSASAGVGSFTAGFDHMAELVGRSADQVIASRHAAE